MHVESHVSPCAYLSMQIDSSLAITTILHPTFFQVRGPVGERLSGPMRTKIHDMHLMWAPEGESASA